MQLFRFLGFNVEPSLRLRDVMSATLFVGPAGTWGIGCGEGLAVPFYGKSSLYQEHSERFRVLRSAGLVRGLVVTRGDQIRQHAVNCLRLSEGIKDRAARHILLQMAYAWSALADQADRNGSSGEGQGSPPVSARR